MTKGEEALDIKERKKTLETQDRNLILFCIPSARRMPG